MSKTTRDRIMKKAYEIWEPEGRPTGRDMEHWFRAEQEEMTVQERAPAAKKATAKKSATAKAADAQKP
ncbi:MAG: DUF2934 domain-containing protein, partial [Alphaproteobacteria bacterium]|nr:DUF2934 domain-containing protein [Alphaproteobacteria bacterium]